ncbi:MAG: hypothetical protein FJ098_04255 [Deltaproteobacteria bacterium]|nr:hypothetical protein [Deltaproteobacteria bacterium]
MRIQSLSGSLAVAALLLAGAACTDLTKTEKPQLELQIGGQSMPAAHEFPKIDPNASPDKVKVEVLNTGGRALIVYDVYLVEGGNQYIALAWDGVYGPADFPITIEPDYPGTKFDFHVQYDPESDPVDISDSVLVVVTNDPNVLEVQPEAEVSCPEWAGAPWFEGGEDPGYKVFEPDICTAYRTPLQVQKVGANIQLNATSVMFSCVVGSKTQTIEVDNVGTDTLHIESIGFDSPTTEFTIANPPALPLDIPPQGDPGNYTLSFDVMYNPLDDDFDDMNRLRIHSNATNTIGGDIYIEIEILQKPAVLQITSSSPFGYLDFSETKDHTINMYNKKPDECNDLCPDEGECCGCPVLIQNLKLTPAEAADWYTYTIWDPDKEAEVTLGGGKSLAAGKAFDFKIHYAKPAGEQADMNGNLCIEYVAPGIGASSQCMSLLASSQCDLELGPPNAQLNFNSISPQDVKSKYVTLTNRGSAPCTVNSVLVTDKWNGVSEDFALAEEWPAGGIVEGFSVEKVEVQFSPHSTNLQGFLKVSYEHPVAGTTEDSFTLNGYSEQECLVPVADMGAPADYEGYAAGSTVVVNGCGSSAGACGDPIYTNGYIWMLLDKPEDSAASLNMEGSCTASFFADREGTYTLGLVVYEASSAMFLQSDPATLEIDVAPAAD